MEDAVAYVRRRYWNASGQHVIPPLREALLKLVRNWFSAGSARKVGRGFKACASDMFNMPALLTKRDMKPKTLIGSLT